MKIVITLFLFLASAFSFSQEYQLKGKIVADGFLSDILVVNLTKESETKANENGDFIIYADKYDLIVFDSKYHHKLRYLVEEFFNDVVEFKLESKAVLLDEVEVSRVNISAESLGIIPKGMREYTVAERRLKTASEVDLMVGFGFSMSLDPLINALTGKTKRLKNILKIERFQERLKYLDSMFSEDFYISRLGIDGDEVSEFKYYSLHHLEVDLKDVEKVHFVYGLSRPELEVLLIALAKEFKLLKLEE